MNQSAVTKKILTVFLSLVLALSLFLGLGAFSYGARAEDQQEDLSNWSETVSVTNGSLSGDGAAVPSSWSTRTEEGFSTTVKSGVVDISNYGSLSSDIKENSYGLPSSINTPASATDDAIAFINAKNGAKTVYGFSSPSITLDASSYYKFTVQVKTIEGAKASFTINGLDDEPVGIMNIDTTTVAVDEKGWALYTIFVETDALSSKTVTADLLLGSPSPVIGGESNGIVYFDNLTVTELSSKLFYEDAKGNSSTVTTISVKEDDAYCNFDSSYYGVTVEGSTVAPSYYNAENGFVYNDKIIRPAFDDGETNKILAIKADYDADSESYTAGYAGVKNSAPFSIARYSYYRLSGWFYAVDGATASIALENRSVTESDEEYEGESVSLTLDTTKKNHNGWQEFVVYIKGSDRFDYLVNMSLCLGTADAPSEGAVFFDDICFRQVTPAVYTANNSTAAKAVTLDTDPDKNGITNGWLNSVDTYDEFDKNDIYANPFAPTGWTKQTTNTVSTTGGYAKNEVSTENAVSGLVPIEDNNELIQSKGIEYGNALMLSSSTPTAFCYESSTFTVTASTYTTLTVGVVANAVTGYGANLVLKRGTEVIGSIEKIKANAEYTFYIKGGNADSTLSVELWLGLNDREVNNTKLSSGTVYFTRVNYNSSSTQTDFDPKYASYANDRYSDTVRYAAINLGDEDLSAFDPYDNDGLAHPYNWSLSAGNASLVKYGVFDANHNNRNIIPSTYTNGDARYAIALVNSGATYSTLTLNNGFKLVADTYYKLSFSAKTDLSDDTLASDDAVGAFISIGNDFRFDFKKTEMTVDSTVDKEYFRTYTFYIKTSSEETTTNITIGLGGATYTKNYAVGKLYINGISLEEITDLIYDDAVSSLTDGENLIDEYTMRASFAAADTDTEEEETAPTTSSSDLWWLVPSILLGVAIVIAVVGTFIRKAIENRPKKMKVETVSSYDRRRINMDGAAPEEKENKQEPVTEIPAEEITEAPVETTAETVEEPAENAEQTTEEAPAESTENGDGNQD